MDDHIDMPPADRQGKASSVVATTGLAEGAGDAASDPVRRLLGRGSLYTIATAIQLASGLLAIPILTRILDPAQYGTVTAALVVQAVLVNVAAFGMPVAVQRTFFRDGGPRASRALIFVTLAGAILVGAIAYLTGPLWSGIFEGVPWGGVLQLAVLAAVPSAVLLSAQLALQASDRVRGFLASAAIATVGAQGLGIALAAGFDDPVAYMGGVAGGFTVAAVVAWIAAGVDPGALIPPESGRALVRCALALGLPTIPHGLALYLLSAGDRVVIERLEGLPAAGAYYVAYAIGSLAIFFVAGLNGAWQPMVFGSPEESRWRFLADSTVGVLRVVAATVAMLALGAPLALAVFAPPDYDVSGLGSVSALVAASALPYLWYSVNSSVIVWRGRTGALAVATPLSVALNLVLCAVLVPPLGLEGAALATLAAYLVLALLTAVPTRSLGPIPWDLEALARASVPAIAGIALALLIPDDGAWLALRGVLAAGAGVTALLALASPNR